MPGVLAVNRLGSLSQETTIPMNTPAPASPNAPQRRSLRIAIAGNPNCGKTTLFNALTGLRHKVANYPGVTVEKKEGALTLEGIGEVTVADLPGIYSLSSHSIDEIIATRALLGELKGEALPDLIVAVLDASNLERNLYLATQLIDLGVPVVIALNMIDLAQKRGLTIAREPLAHALGVPIVPVVANKREGLTELKQQISRTLQNPPAPPPTFRWLPPESPFRQAAMHCGAVALPQAREELRFFRGAALLSEARTVDSPAVGAAVQEQRALLQGQGIDPFSIEATRRYEWINGVVKRCCAIRNTSGRQLSERVDAIITHRLWGMVIFLLLMTGIFQSIFMWAELPMEIIEGLFTSLSALVGPALPKGDLRSLIVDGIIPGVGSVVVFIPQIAILFLFLGLLEDSGYLSRAAFLMDRIMRRFGLQGRSFIPLLSSFACAIPGIMSTRTIPSFADRMATILIAPLMSCSARLPVYTLLIAAFVPDEKLFGFVSLQGLVLLSMYLLGVLGAVVVAWLLKSTIFRGEPALFVMEMPPFRRPSLLTVITEIKDRIVLFLQSAGTVILACSVLLWFIASYPKGELRDSYAGRIGAVIEPAIKPLGFNWEIGVGILASFAAREVFVSSLATVYNIEDDGAATRSLSSSLRTRREQGRFSTLSAISLMVFYVFACQCMSTLAVCRRETGSWKWPIVMFVYMTTLAYLLSLATYQIGLRLF